MEPGQTVQLIVEEENKPEPELVQTQLQLMVVQIVLVRRLKLRTVTNRSAQVQDTTKNLSPNQARLSKNAHFNFLRKHIPALLYNLDVIQLTVGGVITEPGQNVRLNVEEEHKPEPGHALTQLQLMEEQIVLGRQLKPRTVTINLA